MRRLNAVGLAAALSACGAPIQSAPNVRGIETYPHEVEYELLGQAKGKACAGEVELKAWRGSGPVGDRWLYHSARIHAIDSIEGADGLVEARAVAFLEGANLCVVVVGRAYRITAMRAVAPGLSLRPPRGVAKSETKVPLPLIPDFEGATDQPRTMAGEPDRPDSAPVAPDGRRRGRQQ
jgi:hypothetical protein